MIFRGQAQRKSVTGQWFVKRAWFVPFGARLDRSYRLHATYHDQLPRRHLVVVLLGDSSLAGTAAALPRLGRFSLEDRVDGQVSAAADSGTHGMVLPTQRDVDAFAGDAKCKLG